ncbi:MAG TPA: hypothetical protein VMW50_08840, partial [Dehalococcoidia bacterium]|nr:hypothetical protein [Dehalococcoidia bacterium]
NNITPESVFDEQIRSGQEAIQQEFETNLNLLNNQRKLNLIEPDKYQFEAQKIYTSAKQKAGQYTMKMNETKQKLQNMRSLVDQGSIDPAQADAAAWKMMGITISQPQERTPSGMPFSPQQQIGYEPSIDQYTEAVKPHFWTNVPQGKLIGQYLKWREMQGYSDRTPRQQYQLDKIWDAKMKSDDDLKWNPEDAAIIQLRAKSTDIFQRVHTARLSTPLSSHLTAAKPKPSGPDKSAAEVAPMRFHAFTGHQLATPARSEPVIYARNSKTGQRIMSNNGGKTWQPAK